MSILILNRNNYMGAGGKEVAGKFRQHSGNIMNALESGQCQELESDAGHGVIMTEAEAREGWKIVRRGGMWMKVLDLDNVKIQLVRDEVSEQEQVVLAIAYDYAKLVRELKLCEPTLAHDITKKLLDKKYDLLLESEKLIFITTRPPARR